VKRYLLPALILLIVLSTLIAYFCGPARLQNDSAGVRINEVMSDNTLVAATAAGDFADWIELYNPAATPVNLQGFFLSDNPENLLKWQFPDCRIAENGYLILWASGQSTPIIDDEIHLAFRIAASGESLFLTAPDGKTVVDHVDVVALARNHSYGRQSEARNDWAVYQQPSPLAINHEGVILPRASAAPTFSHRSGFYPREFDLTLSAGDLKGDIFYTLDGSVPDPVRNPAATIRYQKPIQLCDRSGARPDLANINSLYGGEPLYAWGVRINRFVSLPENVLGRGTPVRAVAIDAATNNRSQVVSASFFIGKALAQEIKVPVVSIITAPGNFFDNEDGIYVSGKIYSEMGPRYPAAYYSPANFHQRGRHYLGLAGKKAVQRRDGKIEIAAKKHGFPVETNSTTMAPQEITQVKITGTARHDGTYYLEPESTPDKLVINADYGPEVFSNGAIIYYDWERPVSVEFFDEDADLLFSQDMGVRIHGNWSRIFQQKSLRLDARQEYSPAGSIEADLLSDSGVTSFKQILLRMPDIHSGIRDILGQELLLAINPRQVIQHFRPVVLFLNGEFWGLYMLRNMYDPHFLGQKCGADAAQIDTVDGRGIIVEGAEKSAREFERLANFIRQKDLAQEKNFRWVEERFDLSGYTYYMIHGIYLNYTDWGAKHTAFWRVRSGSARRDGLDKWQILPKDYDYIGGVASADILARILASDEYFLKYLLQNPSYRKDFLNTFADVLNAGLDPRSAGAVVDRVVATIPLSLVDANLARYPGSAFEPFYLDSRQKWLAEIDDMHRFLKERPNIVRQQIVEEFSLDGLGTLTLATDFSKGQLAINSLTIDTDARPEGDEGTWTGTYFLRVPVTLRALPRPGYRFVGWLKEDGTKMHHQVIKMTLVKDEKITAVFE
jgi:hypothetical protein